MPSKKFIILPRRWHGMRNDEASVLLEPNEWADSLNFDTRFGWLNDGSSPEIGNGNSGESVIGIRSFYLPTGAISRGWITHTGDIYEETTDVPVDYGAVLLADSAGNIPHFARGLGALVIPRSTFGKPVWRDPADNTWKVMTTAPNDFRTMTFDFGGPRLFGAPGSEPDTWVWTNAGSMTDWSAGDSGAEPIGNDREPIIVIEAGLDHNIAIYKPNHIYMRIGTDPDTWQIRNVSNDVGSNAPLSVCRIGKSQFFVHESGAYFLNAVGSVSFPALTARIQKTWDEMIRDFGQWLRFAHAAYHPLEHTVHLWVPNQASRVMNRLIKIYVPDGSVTIHDDKPSGGSDFYPKFGGAKILYGTDSTLFSIDGTSEDGLPIDGQITSSIFTGNPPEIETEKRWGLRGILHFYFEAEGSADQIVTVTPRAYLGNDIITGATQTFTVPVDRVRKFKVQMPDTAGWGIDFIITSTTTTGRVRWIGYSGQYENVTDE